MKSSQKVTKVHLDIEPENDSLILGIVSAEPDYKLSLSLNRKLKIKLKLSPAVETGYGNHPGSHFSRYSCHSANPDITYTLVANRTDKNILLKKLDKLDFIFLVSSNENTPDAEEIAGIIRSLDTVTAVFILDPGEIKDKNLQLLIT